MGAAALGAVDQAADPVVGADAAAAVVAAAEVKVRFGVGFRREIAGWIETRPSQLEILEITAEHFFYGRGRPKLQALAAQFPLCVHGLSLSLGTEGPLVASHVQEFADVVRACKPLWISEHVAMTRTADRTLGHLTPIARTPKTLNTVVTHARQLRDACGGAIPLLLENITDHLGSTSEPIRETDFLNQICEQAGTGLLLDLTNLAVNAANHGFDPYQWLNELEPRFVQQFHVVGYSRHQGIAFDCHSRDLTQNADLCSLTQYALQRFQPKGVIIERDENFPQDGRLDTELKSLLQLKVTHAPPRSDTPAVAL